jgi:hypothetical protein
MIMAKRASIMTRNEYDRLFSADNPKAVKALDFGYVNAILYMAPHSLAGVGNLCSHASPGCIALCLGHYSGQAGMVKGGNLETGTNTVRESRKRKARLFMTQRPDFVRLVCKRIGELLKGAAKEGLQLCVRLNGATDIGWEGVRHPYSGLTVFAMFPQVQFVDYTKNPRRMLAWCEGKLPANYHLTFSRSEANWSDCERVLKAGGNVAAVFSKYLPETYNGFAVIDGDKHDLRHVDATGGVIVGLLPKGLKARRDKSGFVIAQ